MRFFSKTNKYAVLMDTFLSEKYDFVFFSSTFVQESFYS
jgi:membrane-anchored protein YejM (alkaline phosphatase superfamily)